jgi:hypothetical protein
MRMVDLPMDGREIRSGNQLDLLQEKMMVVLVL